MVEEANVAGRCETAAGSPSLEELGRAFQNLPHPVVIHRRGVILWVIPEGATLVKGVLLEEEHPQRFLWRYLGLVECAR
ncbi:hypothetical protein ACFFRE_03435 [Aciditerrimonas ferrireducens]|uniref:Uncharacterized protein n=1 Tax=Aciditerrimonas ferrireducens TaxID=667306 RepID=A0ABV6C0J3_9ACTN